MTQSAFFFVFTTREEKKKKPEGCNAEEKCEITSSGAAVDQGSKGGGVSSQPPPKRGQKVREASDKIRCSVPQCKPKQYKPDNTAMNLPIFPGEKTLRRQK